MAALTTRLLLSALLVAMPARAAVRVVDDTGATVALAAPATRIITLAPHARSSSTPPARARASSAS